MPPMRSILPLIALVLLAGCAGAGAGSSPLERTLPASLDETYEAVQAALTTRQFETVHVERSSGAAAISVEHWNAAARTRGRAAEVTRLTVHLASAGHAETRVVVQPDESGYAGVAGTQQARALLEEIAREVQRRQGS